MIRQAQWANALAILVTAAPARAEKVGELFYIGLHSNRDLGPRGVLLLSSLAGRIHWLSCEGNPTLGALEQAFKNWAAKHPEAWPQPAWLGRQHVHRLIMALRTVRSPAGDKAPAP